MLFPNRLPCLWTELAAQCWEECWPEPLQFLIHLGVVYSFIEPFLQVHSGAEFYSRPWRWVRGVASREHSTNFIVLLSKIGIIKFISQSPSENQLTQVLSKWQHMRGIQVIFIHRKEHSSYCMQRPTVHVGRDAICKLSLWETGCHSLLYSWSPALCLTHGVCLRKG